jgi:hypothetical protein
MLHGRSAETARIDVLLAAARHGRSGALVIRGEAGVGKTALLDYAAATAGMRVLRGTGIESEAELPFAALQLLLRPGLGRLDLLPPPQAQALRGAFGLAGTPGADRFLIGLATLSLLAELAGDAALLCVVDDAHWLDRASADALQFAARRLGSEGVVLLASAREDGFEAPGLPELTLGRLGREASRALLAERAPGLPPALADRVLAEADGNPLALLELPAALSGSSKVPVALAASLELPAPLPLPRRLQQSYYRQVAALPAPTRTFLLAAAAEETGDLDLVRRAAQALGVLSTAQACRTQGVIRFLAPLSLGLSCANFCLTRFRAATEGATEGLRLAQDTGQPVREAGLCSMLALLAAITGDEARCRELAGSALRQFAAEEVANVSTMAEWALALLDLGLGRYGAALDRFEMTATGSLRYYIEPILFAGPDRGGRAIRRRH